MDDEEESFVLEDPTPLKIDTIDSHFYDILSVPSSDSGDCTNLKRKKIPDPFSPLQSVTWHSLLKEFLTRECLQLANWMLAYLLQLQCPIYSKGYISWIGFNMWSESSFATVWVTLVLEVNMEPSLPSVSTMTTQDFSVALLKDISWSRIWPVENF